MGPNFEPNFFNLEFIYYRLYLLLDRFGAVPANGEGFLEHLKPFFIGLQLTLILASLAISVLMIFLLHKIYKLRDQEWSDFIQAMRNQQEAGHPKNERWEAIMARMESENEADWRLAVIDADKMLDDLLTLQGYQGDGIGEKLISVEKGDMQTLDLAWEAHKFRNRIAHETDFDFPQKEAKRVISLYEKVFKEFQYI